MCQEIKRNVILKQNTTTQFEGTNKQFIFFILISLKLSKDLEML